MSKWRGVVYGTICGEFTNVEADSEDEARDKMMALANKARPRDFEVYWDSVEDVEEVE